MDKDPFSRRNAPPMLVSIGELFGTDPAYRAFEERYQSYLQTGDAFDELADRLRRELDDLRKSFFSDMKEKETPEADLKVMWAILYRRTLERHLKLATELEFFSKTERLQEKSPRDELIEWYNKRYRVNSKESL